MKIATKVANVFQTYQFLKLSNFPNKVKIVEVGPRDGLQNEKTILKTEFKVSLIESLADTGLQTVECTSFVSPKWVPQMADSSSVYEKINKLNNVSYPVLVPNSKGMETAVKLNVKEIAVFTAASEAFTKKNTNCTIDESLVKIKEIIKIAKEKNISVRGYVSCVMGCPYEGEIDPSKVNKITEELLKLGCYEVSLGDTIGKGTPGK